LSVPSRKSIVMAIKSSKWAFPTRVYGGTWLASFDPAGAGTIVAELDRMLEESGSGGGRRWSASDAADIEVRAMAWDGARGVVWIAGTFGVLALQPPPRALQRERGRSSVRRGRVFIVPAAASKPGGHLRSIRARISGGGRGRRGAEGDIHGNVRAPYCDPGSWQRILNEALA